MGEIVVEERESDYDYTLPPSDDPGAPQTAWYHTPITSRPRVDRPVRGNGRGQGADRIRHALLCRSWAATQNRPAWSPSTIHLEGMRQLVADLDFGATGYGTVYPQSGAYLAHPVPGVGGQHDDLRHLHRTGRAGNRGRGPSARWTGDTLTCRRQSPATGQESVGPLHAHSQHGLGAHARTLGRRHSCRPARNRSCDQTTILLVGAVLLFLSSPPSSAVDSPTHQRLWMLSLIVSPPRRRSPSSPYRACPLRRPVTDGVAITHRTELDRYVEQLRQEYAEFGYSPLVGNPHRHADSVHPLSRHDLRRRQWLSLAAHSHGFKSCGKA